jgi:putative phosphonate metabolism protein
MRCAIYFTPPRDHPLTVAAARWIGRDAFTGKRIDGVETAGITESDRAYLTAPPRRYGFHATLKAPFGITDSGKLTVLNESLRRFCSKRPPAKIPETRIALLDDYFALVPTAPCNELSALAADVVGAFDSFRAPLTERDFAKRGREHLTDRQLNHLLNWGYPFVFEDFRFHMTLTGPVPRLEREHVADVLQHYFGPLATAPLAVDHLALFIEPEPYAPLVIHAIHSLAPAPAPEFA